MVGEKYGLTVLVLVNAQSMMHIVQVWLYCSY